MAENANVNIVVSAFTKAAQDALDEVGDELNDVAADSKPASSALDEVGDQLDDTTSSSGVAQAALDEVGDEATSAAVRSRLLANQMDEVSDQMNQASRSSLILSGNYGVLSTATTALSAASSALSVAMYASVIPSIVALSSVIVPLTAALGGAVTATLALVGAFAGLIGVGVLTHMQELKAAFQDVKAEILATVEPLGDVFGPLLVDAVRALPTLVQRIVDSLGPLDAFRDAFVRLGGIAMEVIPAVTAVMADLARDALPALFDVIGFLRSEGPAAFRAMQTAMAEMGPELAEVGGALMDILPTLFDLGLVVSDQVFPAFSRILNVLDAAIERVLSLDPGLRTLAVQAAILGPAIFGVASAAAGLVTVLGPVISAIGSLSATAIGAAGAVSAAGAVLVGLPAAIVAIALATQQGTDAFDSLMSSVQGLKSDLEDLADDALAAVAPMFDRVTSTIEANQGTIDTFLQNVLRAVGGVVDFLRSTLVPTLRFVFNRFWAPLLDRATQLFADNFGEIVTELNETLVAIMAAVQVFAQMFNSFWNQWGDEITTIYSFYLDALVSIAATALDALITAFLVVLNVIQGDWGEAWREIKAFATRVLNGIVNFLTEWGFVDAWNSIISGVTSTVSTFFTTTLPGLFVIGLSQTLAVLQSWGNQFVNIFIRTWNQVIQLGRDALQAVISQTVQELNRWLSTIEGVANTVAEVTGGSGVSVGRIQQRQVADAQQFQLQQRQTQTGALAQQNAMNLALALNLDVTGDGPLAEFFRQQAEVREQSQQRNQERTARRRNISTT